MRHDAYTTRGPYAGFLMALATSLNNVRRHGNAVRRDAPFRLNISSLSPDGEPSEELSADSGKLTAVAACPRASSQRLGLLRPGS